MGWKKLGKKLLHPPIWLTTPLVIISALALPFVFVKGWEETPIAYAVYVTAFYTLLVLCGFFARVLPKRYRKIRQKLYDNPLGKRYMTDAVFKVRISLSISLAITVSYSVFKIIAGFLYSSFWLGAVAVYYILLSVIRFLLLCFLQSGNGKRDRLAEYRRYRLSAVLLMLITLTLSGIVLNMIVQNRNYAYSDVYVIASATYTFYILTVSVVEIVKYRKYQNPVLSAAKAIRFAAALVSLLSLETAMLVQFGEDEAFRRLMTAFTGAGVCAVILVMASYMIVHANKEIQKVRSNQNE